jgi:large subunit ribosomal protein L23
MSKTLLLKPRVSEKSYGQSLTKNTYVFVVPNDANRTEVANAVEVQFEVSVTGVNILNVKGKAKRTVRKGGRQSAGRDSDFKKAYVTLKEGDSIAVFAAEDDAKDKEQKANERTSKAVGGRRKTKKEDK